MRDHFTFLNGHGKSSVLGKSIAPTAAHLHRNSDKMVNSLTSVSCTIIPLNQLKTNAFSHNLVSFNDTPNYFQSLIFFVFGLVNGFCEFLSPQQGVFAPFHIFYSIKSIR